MYNFGSPRVGNKRFAEVYNEVRKEYNYFVNVFIALLHTILNLVEPMLCLFLILCVYAFNMFGLFKNEFLL